MLASESRKRLAGGVIGAASRAWAASHAIADVLVTRVDDGNSAEPRVSTSRPRSRSFGALAGHSRSLSAGAQSWHGLSHAAPAHTPTLPLTSCAALFVANQTRGLKVPAWLGGGRGDASPANMVEPAEPQIDVEAIEQVVALAGPGHMDAATWTMIHSGAWFNTYAAELLLQTCHDYSGLTWFGVIPVTVMVVRTLTLPMAVEAQRSSHFMTTHKETMQALMKKMNTAAERGVPLEQAMKDYQTSVAQVYKDAKITPWMMPLFMVMQLPLMTGFYFAFTGMCLHSLPSMVAESAQYGMDLTTVDPMHYWPTATVLSLLLPVGISVRSSWHTLPENMQTIAKGGMFVLPPLLLAAFWNFPVALCYYWALSNVYTLVQELVLRIPSVRRAVGLPTWKQKMDAAMAQKLAADRAGGSPLAALLGAYNQAASNSASVQQNALAEKAAYGSNIGGGVKSGGGSDTGMPASAATVGAPSAGSTRDASAGVAPRAGTQTAVVFEPVDRTQSARAAARGRKGGARRSS